MLKKNSSFKVKIIIIVQVTSTFFTISVATKK